MATESLTEGGDVKVDDIKRASNPTSPSIISVKNEESFEVVANNQQEASATMEVQPSASESATAAGLDVKSGGENAGETENEKGKENKSVFGKETATTSQEDSASHSSKEESKENLPIFQFMTGIVQDIKARAPLYKDDWKRPRSIMKILDAAIFAFVVQLIPALIFAELLDRQTHGNLAVAETLLSAGIIGIIYALISGQPLTLLGITGPVAILLGTSYGLAEKFNAKYFPFFWWLCLWTAILHLLTAIFGLVNFVWRISPFTSQIFEFFIAMSFIYESIRDLVEPVHFASADIISSEERSAGYASLIIGIMTFVICWTLHFAETWGYFTREIRAFLTSYNMMIALIIMTALSYLPGVDQPHSNYSTVGNTTATGESTEILFSDVGEGQSLFRNVPDSNRLLSAGVGTGITRVHIRSVPWNWQPTCDCRSWITDPMDGIDIKGIFGALFPAFMLYLLFFIDHNISSILTQANKYNLKKTPAYHWDFFCLGLTIIPCAIFGLPPGSGLIPQAPLHTRALCTRKHIIEPESGIKHEVVTHCEEQRWSALLQAALMFVALSLIVVISWIPVACLFGIFLYLGVGAMYGNEIWERITLNFMLTKNRPPIPIVKNVQWTLVQLFTLLQIACAIAIFGVAQFASVGYIFPALVAALVPIRSYIVSRLFSEEDLKYLDPISETEEEYLQEQHEIHETRVRAPSIDESEAIFHGFSSYRPKGHAHDPYEHFLLHPEAIDDYPEAASAAFDHSASHSGEQHRISATGLRHRQQATTSKEQEKRDEETGKEQIE